MNIAPNLESLQVGEYPPEESVAKRLERLLDGRSPWKWAEQVRLSSGAVSRMLKGSLPDPEKLVPAIYIENLSLSWLVDGIGHPFLVHSPVSEEEEARLVRQHMERDRAGELLVVYSPMGYTPVLHSLATGCDRSGREYSYRSVSIIGGGSHGPALADAIIECSAERIDGQPAGRVRSLRMIEAGWQLLAWGEMGNYKLFGDDLHSGFFAKSKPEVARIDLASYRIRSKTSLGQVRDSSQTWFDSSQREMNALFERLDAADQDAALRMLRGLSLPHD